MGPGRYICGCERRIPHANAYSYCYCHRYGDGDSDSDTNSNSDAYRYSDGHSYSYSNAQTHTYSENCDNTEASSYPCAETVGTLAGAKIFAIGDRC